MKRFVARIAPIAFVTLASVGVYACSDSTGPDSDGGRTATIAVQPVFQSAAAGVVDFTQAHVIAHRSDGSVALDSTFDYTASAAGAQAGAPSPLAQSSGGIQPIEVKVPFSRVVGPDGENFTIEFDLLDLGGNAMFHGGPTTIHGDPESPSNISVSTLYTGTGASAVRVEITPATTAATTGATVNFTARAFGPNDTEIPGTPIQFTSVTPSLATVPNDEVGSAVMGSARGTARIRATLVTGQSADALVTINALPTNLAVQSGNNQSLAVNSVAAPLVVKVTAADGSGVGDVAVAFAIQSGGGSLGSAQATTNEDGLASVGYTFGQTPGQVTVLATVAGLTGSPATFNLTGTASAVSQIVFASQPTDALVGSSIGTVSVEARDQFGNKVTSFTGSVNVALDGAPAGVLLQGNGNVNAVGGVATFTGLTVSAPGTALRLRATATGVPIVLSNTFTITARPATRLAFFTQPPATVNAGDAFSTAVRVLDDLGNLVPSFNGTVGLTLTGATGGATLGGGTSIAAVAGVASFQSLTVSAATPAVRLTAAAAGLTNAVSSQFAVLPPSNPLVATPATTNFAAQRTGPSPSAAVVNLTSSGPAISGLAVGTITYGPGATGWLIAGLGGGSTPTTLTLTPTTGTLPEGTFTATVPLTGTGGFALSYTVSVTVAPLPVTQLVVITSPAGASSGATFVTHPVIELRDATNTRVLSANGVVTASIASGTGVLGGTVAVNAIQGRATFSNLRITGTGGHTLQFAIAGPVTVTTAPFAVAAALTTTLAVPTVSGTGGIALAPVTPVTAAGGVPPYAFSLASVLPAGLVFSGVTGQITGTPASAFGPTLVTVTATDAAGTQSSKGFTLVIAAGVSTTQAIAARTGDVGIAIPSFVPVTATGGTSPVTFAISPAATLTGIGLAFNTGTGAVSGTPTGTLATTTFTVTATDAVGSASSKTFNLTVNSALTTTQAIASRVGTQSTAIPSFVPVTAAGGTAPYSFALSGGTLPPGMSFSTSTGAITGTPFAPLALTTFTVTVTDAIGATSARTFDLTVNGALTTTQAVPSTTGNSGTPLSFTPVTAAGGTVPYGFALTGGTLPAGLAFNAGTGAITGTPTASLTTTVFTVTVTDAAGAVSAKNFSLTVNGPLSANQTVATKTGTVGAAIASFIPVTANGGTSPYTFAISGGALPTGLIFNTNTGAISGTPSAALAATVFTVTVTDATSANDAATFTLTVNTALSTTLAIPSVTGTVNAAIPAFTPVTASGGTAPYTFDISTPLPAGMSFNVATGQITGTPTVSQGATNRNVTVTDAAGATSFKTFSLTVNPALSTTLAVASRTGTQGTPIAAYTPVTATGGTTPYVFTINAGTLPPGMTLNAGNGQVTGTPTAASVFNFTIMVADAAGATSSKAASITVNATLVANQAVPATTVNAGAAITPFVPVTGSSGTPPYSFAISGTALPAGLSFSTSTGTVSGSPTGAQGATVRTVTITDAAGAQAAATFTLTVNGPLTTTQAIASRTVNSGAAITPFTPVTAAGGSAPLTLSIAPALPAGLAINAATGEISGTPAGALSATVFTVTATDNIGAQSSKTFTLTINGPLTTTQAVAAKVGTVGAAIASFVPVTAAGGTTPYSFALTGGTLPAGLVFSTVTGAISGTPSATLAPTVLTVTVTDASSAQSAKTFSLTVNSALTTTQAVAATVGTVNTAIPALTPVTASGGTTPYSFALSTPLPAGLSFNTATGEISGTPTVQQGATIRSVTVTDAAGAVSSKSFSLAVNGALTTVQAVPTKVGTQGRAIASFTPVTASGGTTPYSFALTGGTLPAGLSFTPATGAISGTPTATLATTVFTVTVTDDAGANSARTFSLTVNPTLVANQAVSATVGTAGTAIPTFTPVTATGGSAPLSFAITAGGALPAGMSFSATTGAVSGTPIFAQGATIRTVTITDAAGATASATFTLTVNATLTTTQAVAVKVVNSGAPITAFTPVTAAGGTAPLAFAINPALPAGLSISAANGQITGTPTVATAATQFTVTVTDNVGATSSKNFTLTVNGPLSTTQAIASRAVTRNSAITPFTPATAGGGTTPYVFSILPALPTGLTINASTGAISGTPTVALAATVFTVTVTDATTAQSSETFTLTVNTALTTTQAVASKATTLNTAIVPFIPVTAAGGTAPRTFAISGPALPAGVLFNTTTGEVSGTPTATQGSTSRTVTVTDAAGAQSSKTFSLAVNGALNTTQAIASRTTTVNRPFFPTATFTPVTASGGTSPYTFAITAGGALPAGVTLSAAGLISGTPTATLAPTAYTITATDAAGAQSSKTVTLAVNTALGATQSVAAKASTINIALTPFTPVTPANGTAPYTYAISGTALPAGLSFSTTTGAVSGTPAVAQGATSRTVTITDAAGATASSTFSLTINAALTTTLAVPSTIGTQSTPLSFTPVTSSGGTAPVTFSVSSLATLTGLGLSFATNTGVVSGTPNGILANTAFTVTATDAAGATSQKTFNLTVNGPLATTVAVPAITLQAGTNLAPTVPVTAAGGTLPYVFALTGGTLPTGMSFNTTNGELSGTPTSQLSTQTFTVTVTDNNGTGASSFKTFDLTVNAIQLLVNPITPETYNVGVDEVIPINIDMATRGTDNLASLTVTVTWDPARFQFVSESVGNGAGWSVTPNTTNAAAGSITLGGFTANGSTTNFTFHNITLKPLTSGPGAAVDVNVTVAANESGILVVVPVRNLTATINP
jgi:hypothetical protein